MNMEMTVIVMLLGGGLALWGLKLKKTNKTLGVFVSVVFSLLTLAVAGQRLWQEFNQDALLRAKTLRVTEARGEILGAHIAAEYPDARVMILKSPAFPGMEGINSTEETLLVGLHKGLPAKQVAAEINLPFPASILERIKKKSSEESAEMLMYEIFEFENWFSAKTFDQFITQHRDDFDILLILASLPMDLATSKVLEGEGAPRIVCGGYSNVDIDPFIRKGIVLASIRYKPRDENTPSMAKVKLPDSSQEIFDLWYQIDTPKTIGPAKQTTEASEAS